MHDKHDRLIGGISRLRRYARALDGGATSADDLVRTRWNAAALDCRHAAPKRHACLAGQHMHNLQVDQVRWP